MLVVVQPPRGGDTHPVRRALDVVKDRPLRPRLVPLQPDAVSLGRVDYQLVDLRERRELVPERVTSQH
jgi:hypothetical protein